MLTPTKLILLMVFGLAVFTSSTVFASKPSTADAYVHLYCAGGPNGECEGNYRPIVQLDTQQPNKHVSFTDTCYSGQCFFHLTNTTCLSSNLTGTAYVQIIMQPPLSGKCTLNLAIICDDGSYAQLYSNGNQCTNMSASDPKDTSSGYWGIKLRSIK